MADTPKRSRSRAVLTVVACVAILAVAAILVMVIHGTEPEAERSGATRKSAALVETVVVSNGTFRPQMAYLGTVEPSRDVQVSPQVPGRIVEVAEAFTPGGFVQSGQALVRIDSEDFKNTLAMRESDLHQAESLLAVEEGRRRVAEREFALLGEEIGAANRALVLREPQIASARAQVEAAEAAVAQARLDLRRTTVEAPFDAHILSRSVNVGSEVAPGGELARLVGVEEYWVMTTVPLRDLERIGFPDDGEEGATARMRHRAAWPEDTYRVGRVKSLIGTVDRQTRLARVVVSVPDPLSRDGEAPPLLLGTIVEVRIKGKAIENVVRLDRNHVREGSTAWVLEDGVLAIRELGIEFEDAQYAYVSEGLAHGDEVVVTPLATVAPGIGLKRIDRDGEPGGQAEE